MLKIVPVENIRFEAIAYAAHVTWTALQKNQLVINEAQTSAKKTTAKFGEQVTGATPTSERNCSRICGLGVDSESLGSAHGRAGGRTKKIAAKFEEHVTCATPTSERITAGFVDSVLTIHSNMFQKNLKSSPVLQPGGQACLVPEPKQTHKHTTHKHIALETLHEHIRFCSHVGRPSSHSTEPCPRRCLIPLRPWSRRVHTPCLRMVHG